MDKLGVGVASARTWDHTCLAVSDLDRAISFYRAAFAYELIFEARELTDQVQRISGLPYVRADVAQLRSPISGHVLELVGFSDVPAGVGDYAPTRPGSGHVAFSVDNLDSAIEQVRALGAELLGEPTEFSEGYAVYCREPSGTVFELKEASVETWMQRG